MGYDRNEVLGRTDLAELADQLVGPHKGRGPGATWPCPDPGHGEQTGRTPPVSMFRTSYGDERWRCHSCGAGGTAIDLVMTTQGVRFPEAIELLARRAGVAEIDEPMPALRTARIARPEPMPEGRPNPDVERFVASAERHLWSDRGEPMRRWLAERGLGEEVLKANRIGADPGPTGLDRPRGLPRGGPAVVLPVLGPDGVATYLQSRYLNPNGHKYDNPSAALAGALPRTAEVRLPLPAADPGLVVVSEGIPDALVAAQAGYRAAAVLGAGVPDERTAAALVERYPTERLILAFDVDGPGQAGARRLHELLALRGVADRVARLEVPAASGDLNGWLLSAGSAFSDQLGHAIARSAAANEVSTATETLRVEAVVPSESSPRADVAHLADFSARPDREPSRTHGATPSEAGHEDVAVRSGNWPSSSAPAAPGADRSGDLAAGGDGTVVLQGPAVRPQSAERAAPDLIDWLETIRYHHLLVDDPAVAAFAVTRVEQALSAWTTDNLAVRLHNRVGDAFVQPMAGLPEAPGMADLDGRLEQLAYQYVLLDDPDLAQRNLETAGSTVREWSSQADRRLETEIDHAGFDPGLAAAQRWAHDHGLVPSPDLHPTGPDLEPPGIDALAIDF